jgi:tRNA (Thr-GGU) A37 N-methylase
MVNPTPDAGAQMSATIYTIEPIGFIRSELARLEAAPLQGDEVAGQKLRVAPLEAVDGTPIVDIKPVLAGLDPSDR